MTVSVSEFLRFQVPSACFHSRTFPVGGFCHFTTRTCGPCRNSCSGVSPSVKRTVLFALSCPLVVGLVPLTGFRQLPRYSPCTSRLLSARRCVALARSYSCAGSLPTSGSPPLGLTLIPVVLGTQDFRSWRYRFSLHRNAGLRRPPSTYVQSFELACRLRRTDLLEV